MTPPPPPPPPPPSPPIVQIKQMQSDPLLPDQHGSCSAGSEVLDTAPPQELPRAATRLPSSRYKGVVPQPNGRWGAQIYERHQRVWLGTFDEESAAAAAYDVAAQRFRGREAAINFGPLSPGADELDFISSRSKSEVVDMLRKHTYADELRQHGRRMGKNGSGTTAWSWTPPAATEMEQLFEKVVTPSDVGKLNRLVIPKQHAEKHFPLKFNAGDSGGGGSGVVLLSFEDRQSGKVWRFRYSYWNSSQSYVLTKGWSRFVREKGLVPGDVISFLRSSSTRSSSSTADHQQLLYIDWKPCRVVSHGLQLQERPCLEQTVQRQPAVRLFGVNIWREPPEVDGGGSSGVFL